jgi:hypothetical protein
MKARKYNKTSFFALVSLLILAVCTMSLGQTEVSMDLIVSYDSTTDSATLQLFPSVGGIDTFHVLCYDGQEALVDSHLVSGGQTEILLSNAIALGYEKVEVIALGSSSVELEKTPLEDIITNINTSVACGGSATQAIQPNSTCCFDLILKDTETSTFPWIYATVRAEDCNGIAIGNLIKEDFYVTEDSRSQNFQLIPQYGVDVVFCVDTSGSMCGEIAQVRDNIKAFADLLDANNVDYRLGLVSFGQSGGANGYGQPITVLGFTDDYLIFKNAVNGLGCSGGTEPGWCAAYHALTDPSLLWRPGVLKVIVVITDEPDNGGCYIPGGDHATICQKIKDEQARVFAAALTSDYNDLTKCSIPPGEFDTVTADLIDLLITIWNDIRTDYIVFYQTDNPAEDCNERHVEITAPNDLVCHDIVDFNYIPNSTPKIQRTQATVDLHLQPLVASTSPTICAIVTDCASPFVNSVILYVRTTGSVSYTPIAMLAGPNDVWCADVPSSLVQTPGIDYYILATDGDKTSTDPSADPATNPYQLAVLPNIAPGITASADAPCYEPNSVIGIAVECNDTTYHIAQVDVHWRPLGQLIWRNAFSMSYGSSDTFVQETAHIDTNECPPDAIGLEFYVEATDDFGVSNVWPLNGRDNPVLVEKCSESLVDIDIKPGSCPNPFNVKSNGVLPVAILGSANLDVHTIDVASILLEGVSPIRSSYEDVATPVPDGNECDCTEAGADGYIDLTLKFSRQDIVAMLGEVNHDDVFPLTLDGALFEELGGAPIQGIDCIVIRGKHKNKPLNSADINQDGVVNTLDFAILAQNWMETNSATD